VSLFETHLRRGKVKKQTPNFCQIRQHLVRARRDLKTYEVVVSEDQEWAATIVYQAMLRAGRALVFAHGYLPADGAQHRTVVELTGALLGSDFSGLVGQFERLRRKRNMFFYDAGEAFSQSEASRSLNIAKKLIGAIECKVAELDPQKSFPDE